MKDGKGSINGKVCAIDERRCRSDQPKGRALVVRKDLRVARASDCHDDQRPDFECRGTIEGVVSRGELGIDPMNRPRDEGGVTIVREIAPSSFG